MRKKALFLQKKHLLATQNEELVSLFREYLPGYEPFFVSSTDEVRSKQFYHLVITSFLDFFPAVMKKIRKPEHLHITGSGTDKLREYEGELDLDGVRITNSAGVNAVTISEHVIAGILTFAKNFHHYRDQQSRKSWKRHWHTEVSGQRAAIIGVGNVGREVARRCSALDLQVTGCDVTVKTHPFVDAMRSISELPEVVSTSDYVVFCVPLSPATRGLVNRKLLKHFKKSAVLINVSRGEVVDEHALIHHLRENRLKGAVLDVFEEEPLPETHPFWELENVIITPHVAGTTQHYMQNMFRILRDMLD